MRVGYFFNHTDFVGGGEYSFIELIQAVQQQGIIPVAFIPGPGAIQHRLKEIGIKSILYQQPSLRGIGLILLPLYTRKLSALMKNQHIDVIHTNGARCMLYAGFAAKKQDIPVVWHVRVLERDGMLDRIRARLATALIANSEAVKTTLRPYVPQPMAIQVIYNSIPPADAVTPMDITTIFNLPHQVPVLLFAGRITPEKSLETLIQAQRILDEQGGRQALLIIGPTPDAAYLRKLTTLIQSSHTNRIIWAGAQQNISAIMRAASVLVLPSKQEGFGRVILEAWQAGLPVVATDQGGPAELIDHGQSGMLVPVDSPRQMADTIAQVLHDEPLRHRLIDTGKEKIKAFDPEEITRQLVDVYQCLL